MKSKYDLLNHFAKLGFTKGAEIGVAEGRFAESMFKAIPNLELWCVDIWWPYRGNRWSGSKERNEHHFKAATERLANYNSHIMKEMSMDAVRKFKDRSLDFVFIDANHAFDYTMMDLIKWTKKVRIGGIVSGDDYYPFTKGKQSFAGVVEAVDAYTKAHDIKFELTTPGEIRDRGSKEQPCYYWTREFK